MRFRVVPFLAITALTVALCEATVRISGFLPRYAVNMTGVPPPRSTLRIELDPERLFRLIPDPALEIGRYGYRGRTLADDTHGEKADHERIAILGDSIPLGMALPLQATVSAQLESLGDGARRAYNYGVQGYGPDQSLLVVEQDVLPFTPSAIVFVIYPENDFNDLLRNGLVTLAGEEISFQRENVVSRLLPRCRLWLVWNLLTTGHFLDPKVEARLDELLFQDRGSDIALAADGEHAQELLRGTLKRLSRETGEHGVRLLIAIVPGIRELERASTKVPALANERLARSIAGELSIPSIDLTDEFLVSDFRSYYTSTDLHLSADGHRALARAIHHALLDGKEKAPTNTVRGS